MKKYSPTKHPFSINGMWVNISLFGQIPIKNSHHSWKVLKALWWLSKDILVILLGINSLYVFTMTLGVMVNLWLIKLLPVSAFPFLLHLKLSSLMVSRIFLRAIWVVIALMLLRFLQFHLILMLFYGKMETLSPMRLLKNNIFPSSEEFLGRSIWFKGHTLNLVIFTWCFLGELKTSNKFHVMDIGDTF